MKKLERMKELVSILNHAAHLYYAKDIEEMSNLEYDQLYDELEKLEQEEEIVLAGSPTQKVGYEAVEELPKEQHEKPMLSLSKTKDEEELVSWILDKEGCLSWKLDGITIVITYVNGRLEKAVTRGNGEEGEVVTNNARVFENLPLTIPYRKKLIIRGEAVIHYSDFEKMNEEIEDVELKYKNPRNLCSGSVRQLNNGITAERKVKFYAFSLVFVEEKEFTKRSEELDFLKSLGLDIVEYKMVNKDSLKKEVLYFNDAINTFDIPSDGLVLNFDDIAYGQSLGMTSKFPRDAIAFKWEDELKETILKEIEWSLSRTGLINPVAIFEPIELEGTTVSRASVHNLSMVKSLALGVGDCIKVYKANMIIPQIAENVTRSNTIVPPKQCPSCGERTEIKSTTGIETLYCMNPKCKVKKIKAFSLFVSRDALNIDGLSEATLEKLIQNECLEEFADLFQLEKFKDEIINMEGFGIKSYEKLVQKIEQARHTTLPRLIYGLGMENIGVANAKMLSKYFAYDMEKLQSATVEELSAIEGIGEVIAKAIVAYLSSVDKQEEIKRLLAILDIAVPEQVIENQKLEGKNFVITGNLEHFSSRNELKELIEDKGGKVVTSISTKVECLINNDLLSASSKNKKAKELDIVIISEEEFIKQYLE